MKAGWELKTLGSLLEVKNGFAFDSKKFTPDAGTPLIRIRDIKEGKGTAINYNGEYNEEFICKQGDFLIGMDGEFGCYEWKGDPSLLNQRVCRLENFDSRLMSRFLFYGINKYLKEIEEITGYTTVKHLSSKTIKTIEFPLPPLEEQKRIVSILDEAFEGLDRARENAEANLKSARELFEGALASVFSEGKKADWTIEALGDICKLQNGFAFKSALFKPSGIPVLRISSIQNNIISDNRSVYVDPSDYKENLDKYKVVDGDLLIAMSGATTGKVGFNQTGLTYLLNQRVGKFEPSKQLERRFLYYFLCTKVEENLEISAGAAQPNLSTQQIKEFKIPLPSLIEQERLVSLLDETSEKRDELQTTYTTKLQDISDLRQSLLQKAFAGELT